MTIGPVAEIGGRPGPRDWVTMSGWVVIGGVIWLVLSIRQRISAHDVATKHT